MHILALHTGLFPDAQTLAAALVSLEAQHRVERMDVSQPEMENGEWDRVLAAILRADVVVTT